MISQSQRKIWPPILIVLILVATALQLHHQDRSWWCNCHSFFWTSDAWGSLTSQTFLDPYSFTHLMHGFMFAGVLLLLVRFVIKHEVSTSWRLVIALAAEALWEILENTNAVIDRYRATTAFLGYRGDTVVNSLGDILCCGIGLLIARKLGWVRSLPIFIATEIVLLFWIRDSLILELIMLIHPIDSIKAWQLAR
ncbi:MAG TPA: DUF2585 family protein [Pyrinomonadaceae bacterium]|nr:DUF2585 family protein [Pyrinomonadaceae bacterium]